MVSRLQVENSTGKGGATVVWIHGFIIVEQWDIAALLNSKEHLKQSEAPVTHVCKVSHPAVNQNSLRNWSKLARCHIWLENKLSYLSGYSRWPYIWARIHILHLPLCHITADGCASWLLFFLCCNLTIGDFPSFLPNFIPRISQPVRHCQESGVGHLCQHQK